MKPAPPPKAAGSVSAAPPKQRVSTEAALDGFLKKVKSYFLRFSFFCWFHFCYSTISYLPRSRISST
jgi:hypothetical protein